MKRFSGSICVAYVVHGFCEHVPAAVICIWPSPWILLIIFPANHHAATGFLKLVIPMNPKHDFLKSRALCWNFNCKRLAEFTHESRFSFFQPTKMCGLLQQNAVSFSTNSYSYDFLSNVRVLKHEHPGDRPQLLLVCSRELADILNIPVSMIEVYLDRKCWQPEWIKDANWLFGSVLKWGKTCCKQMYHFLKVFSPSIFPEISARLFAVYNFWWHVDIPFWHNAQ